MFSGIVEELGVIEKVDSKTNLTELRVRAKKIVKGIKHGDSVCVDGVCLTVRSKKGNVLTFDAMKETLDKTTLGQLKKKDKVNLERALRFSDRISGHFVTGHIDGVGTIKEIIRDKNYIEVRIKAGRPVLGYLVEKGSVCIDGISLTVGVVGATYFSFFLIPYTQQVTTLGFKKKGAQVNIETDILAKYVLNNRIER